MHILDVLVYFCCSYLFNNQGQQVADISSGQIHHGRTLLSVKDAVPDETVDISRVQQNARHLQNTLDKLRRSVQQAQSEEAVSKELMLLRSMEDLAEPLSICPTYFNKTESQRYVG